MSPRRSLSPAQRAYVEAFDTLVRAEAEAQSITGAATIAASRARLARCQMADRLADLRAERHTL